MESMEQWEKETLKKDLFQKAELLKIMAHPVRLCILVKLMKDGTTNVGGLQGCLDVPQPVISQHLGKLKSAGIVKAERSGKEVIYRIGNEITQKIMQAIL